MTCLKEVPMPKGMSASAGRQPLSVGSLLALLLLLLRQLSWLQKT